MGEKVLERSYSHVYKAYIETSTDAYYTDAIAEIESNLWTLSKEDKENYTKKIIRDIDRVSSRALDIHNKLFNEWCLGVEDQVSSDIFERYVVKCLADRCQFVDSLDIVCTGFQIDIFQIQDALGIDLKVDRKVENLRYFRHNELFTTEVIEQDGHQFEVKSFKKQTRSQKGPMKVALEKADIALICLYTDRHITEYNALEIAREFGHENAGRLYQDYGFYLSAANRLGVSENRIKDNNKVKRFEKVITHLTGSARDKAEDDLIVIKGKIEKQ